MHRETPYTIQHSVFAFAKLSAQFALFYEPFLGLLLEYRHFQH